MAKGSTSRSDILEKEYEAGLTQVIRGVVILVASLILMWLMNVIRLVPLVVFAGLGVVGGVWIIVTGARRMYRARNLPTVTVYCPYCQHPNEFLDEPTEDYTCEGCHRRVLYENGKPVPVREITCPTCKTVHKVSEKTTTFTCDRCNRTLRLVDPNDPKRVVAEQTDILRNYDVILTQAGRQPNDVAMALQSILVCNLKEARARMENLPLTVVRDVPERKADAIRTRLRELGATAVIRPTEDAAAAPRRP
jgi:ribosomal protein L7/L12